MADAATDTLLAPARQGACRREHKPAAEGVWTMPLLPGFELPLARIFRATQRPTCPADDETAPPRPANRDGRRPCSYLTSTP